MQEHTEGDSISRIFESIDELYAFSRPIVKDHNPWLINTAEGNAQSYDWFGPLKTGKEAIQKTIEGWPELLQTLKTMVERLDINEEVSPHLAMVRKRKLKYCDSGDSLVMSRVWAGNLSTAWLKPKRTYLPAQTDRRATIFINTAVNCNVSFTETLWRAAAVLKINDMLQSSGRSVEIFSGGCTRGLSNKIRKFSCAAKIKDYTQPLTEEQLAAMSSSAYFRSFIFMANGAFDHPVTTWLGTAADGMPHQLLQRRIEGELIIQIGATITFQQALKDIQNVQNQLIGKGEYLENRDGARSA